MEPWIITNSGIKFDLLETKVHMINIRDIAHALSNVGRFGGHCKQFYSVAQHSVHVSQVVSEEYAFCALMHDATEAYIGDMVSPLKAAIPLFKEVEQNLWEVIASKYGLPKYLPGPVKYADYQLLKAEKRDIMPETEDWEFLKEISVPSLYISAWSSDYSKVRFLKRFQELSGLSRWD